MWPMLEHPTLPNSKDFYADLAHLAIVQKMLCKALHLVFLLQLLTRSTSS